MKCEKCGAQIGDGDQRDYYGKSLCDDCYMDALSPARSCDPWAVHSAKSFAKFADSSAPQFNKTQEAILKILNETGGVEPREMLKRLNISEPEFQREFAALRHMEKVRAELRDGVKFFCLW